MSKPILKSALTGLALLGAATFSHITQAAEVTLTLSHFLSPKAPPHSKFLAPWAKKIEVESKGRIKIQIFPSMTMGGKPPELYRQLRDGAADMVWTLTGYTPGVFPRSEVYELPSVHQGSATATNLAIQENFKLIAADFKDIKPLLIHVHAGNAIHLVNGCVDKPADLKGMKLRTPSRTGAWLIKSWGAEPVGMPVPALPQALSKGVIDGALIPFEIVPPFKIHELTKCSVTGNNDSRFGTSVFMFGMNKDRYNSLPADLKAIIDANSGAAIAEMAGKVWMDAEKPGMALQKKTGSPVSALTQAQTDGFGKLAKGVVDSWVKEVSKKGIDGAALVKAARASVTTNTK